MLEFYRDKSERIAARILDHSPPGAFFRLVLWNIVVGALLGVALFVRFSDFTDMNDADRYRLGSTLYGTGPDGEYEPMAEYYSYRRVLLPQDFVAQNPNNKIVQAFTAMEDSAFYDHMGVDIKGIIRAMFVNIAAGRIKEGASTITQQAARLKFLTFERSFIRKFREAWLAVLMEFYYEKPDIMQIYLNEVPMGHGNRGIVAASRFYFRKDYTELGWGEAALLASLTSRPNYYSPLKNPVESRGKVKVVFRRLMETGRLTRAEVEAEWQKLEHYYHNLNRSPSESAFSERLNKVPWFAEYVRRILEKRYGKRRFYNGGLQIYTSLDVQMQTAAQETLPDALARQTRRSGLRTFKKWEAFDNRHGSSYNLVTEVFGLPPIRSLFRRHERRFDRAFQVKMRDHMYLLTHLAGTRNAGKAVENHYAQNPEVDELLNVEGALITMEVPTGKITAMVGGSKFQSDNQLVRAVDAYRQPGSSFKPILYSAALDYTARNPDIDRPVTAATLLNDTPKFFLIPDGSEWEPQNYSENYSGFILLRRALELSKNMVAIQIPEYIGLGNIHPMLETITDIKNRNHRVMPSTIPKNYSIALGSESFSPLEMARSYAIFANNGKRVMPISILKVTDSQGKVVDDFYSKHIQKEQEQVLLPGTAQIITSMMTGVIQNGTGTGVRKMGFTRPAAGKTGTTDNQRDAWFVGFTPKYVTAVWIGYDKPNLSLGSGATGGGIAAPLWGKYMARAMRGKKVRSFSFPGANTVQMEVCKISGKRPSTHCKDRISEIFHSSAAPKEECKDHFGYETEAIGEDGIKVVDPLKQTQPAKANDLLAIDDGSFD